MLEKNVGNLPLREVSFADFEQVAKGEVWVVNTTKGDRRSVVSLVVAREHGLGSETCIIPQTWIPVQVTANVSRAALIRDPQFRQAVVLKRVLTIVDTDDVHALFRDNEAARKEADRLSHIYEAAGNQFNGLGVEQSGGESQSPVLEGVPSPVQDAILRLESAIGSGLPTEDLEQAAITQLRNQGSLDKDVYRSVYLRVAKYAPLLAETAKALGNPPAAKADKVTKTKSA